MLIVWWWFVPLKIWVLWRLYHHCGHGDPCLVQVEEYNNFFRFLRILRFAKVQKSYGTSERIQLASNCINLCMIECFLRKRTKDNPLKRYRYEGTTDVQGIGIEMERWDIKRKVRFLWYGIYFYQVGHTIIFFVFKVGGPDGGDGEVALQWQWVPRRRLLQGVSSSSKDVQLTLSIVL